MKEYKHWVKDLNIYCLEKWASKKDIEKIQKDAYNSALDTAIALVNECYDDKTLICGLENSKIK